MLNNHRGFPLCHLILLFVNKMVVTYRYSEDVWTFILEANSPDIKTKAKYFSQLNLNLYSPVK